MKFSLCMIVKNETRTLARCLDSLKDIMDEIIIVDTGSTDDTKKIASRYTTKIYDYEQQGILRFQKLWVIIFIPLMPMR